MPWYSALRRLFEVSSFFKPFGFLFEIIRFLKAYREQQKGAKVLSLNNFRETLLKPSYDDGVYYSPKTPTDILKSCSFISFKRS